MMQHRILLVEGDATIAQGLSAALTAAGKLVHVCAELRELSILLRQETFDLVLVDLEPDRGLGLEALQVALRINPAAKVFVFASAATIPLAVTAMRQGASGFLHRTGEPRAVVLGLAAQLRDDPADQALEPLDPGAGLVGESLAMRNLVATVRRLQRVDSTVLILGESGTGKEVIARAIHASSRRNAKTFGAINCGAIPEALLESELFGHRKGAFTDAKEDRIGIFAAASGGTLLLDEIGDMPLALQTKLLRVLQEKEITPVGAATSLKVDTRIIAATHRNILREVVAKRFREDLFYRLAVVVLHIPPLRQRAEDVPALIRHFLGRLNRQFDKRVHPPKARVLEKLQAYHWPGNVRELQNVIERAVILARDDEMEADVLLQPLDEPPPPAAAAPAGPDALFVQTLTAAKQGFEKAYLEKVLDHCQGDVAVAARISGRNRADIYRMMRRHGFAPAAGGEPAAIVTPHRQL